MCHVALVLVPMRVTRGFCGRSTGLGLQLRIPASQPLPLHLGLGFGDLAYIFFSGASNYNYVLKINSNSKSSYPNWDTLADVPYSMCPTHAPLNARARYTLHGASSHALCVVDSTREKGGESRSGTVGTGADRPVRPRLPLNLNLNGI